LTECQVLAVLVFSERQVARLSCVWWNDF